MLSRAQWSCCSQSPIGWRWFNRGKKRRAHLWGRPYLLAPQLGFPSWGVFYHVPLPSPYAPLPDPSPLTSDVHSEGCPDCSLCPLPPTPWNVSPALARKLWGCPLIPSPHSSWKNLPIPASIPSLAPRCSEWSLDTKGKDLGLPWYGCDPLFLCPRPCLLLSSVTSWALAGSALVSPRVGLGRHQQAAEVWPGPLLLPPHLFFFPRLPVPSSSFSPLLRPKPPGFEDSPGPPCHCP